MRKMMFAVAALALALGVSGAAQAVCISNLSGQSCGDSTGTWHFVNNQTGGAAAGTLSASWDSGDACTKSADSVNKTTQHFYCTASGELESACTNLPGRLVLSDFSCDTKKEEPPKK
jgi:hypothetical protein